MDVLLHEGEHVRVVGGGSQHQLSVTKSVRYRLRHIAAGKVMNNDPGAALGFQLLRQQLGGFLRMSVNGGVGNHNALALHPVAGPDVIQVQVVSQIFRQHRSVEGADDLNIQSRRLLEQSLHLRAVLAHDADIVPPGLVVPGLVRVQRAELAEAVGGEQHLVRAVIGHNDLRPMHHGCGNKGQGVLSKGQGASLSHHDPPVGIVRAEEVLHHGKGLGGGNHGSLRVDLHEIRDVGGVIRLHVLHHQIVRRAARQRRRQQADSQKQRQQPRKGFVRV